MMHRFWFGKHKDKPLSEVPSDYLDWALRTCKLSTGTRAAVIAELQSRGVTTPAAPPPPRAVRPCPTCGPGAPVLFAWREDSLGRKRVCADCGRCGRWIDTPPSVPPYSSAADTAAGQPAEVSST
jgi:hypothetical protein